MATIGMSASLNQIAILFVQIVLNNSLTYYGQFTKFGSDIPLAACGIVMKTNAILLAIIIGISQGMQPIIGFNYGAQKYERVKKDVQACDKCKFGCFIYWLGLISILHKYCIINIWIRGCELF